jgi:hypothetical protein
MKNEFIRFGLGKFGTLTAILEIVGAIGLLVGLLYNAILLISSGGLALLMFLGVGVRLKLKTACSFILFYCALNLYIFIESLKSSWDKHSTLLTYLAC